LLPETLELLTRVGSVADGDPRRQGYRDYCRLRAEGKRDDALASLTAFLALAESWPSSDRFAFARWLAEIANFERGPPLIPNPLVRALLEPAVAERAAAAPADAEARMLLGLFGNAADPCAPSPLDHYRAAHALDPANPVVSEVFVRAVLRGVAYSQHEMPYLYLGAPQDDAALLEQALGAARAADWGGRYLGLIEERLDCARNAVVDPARQDGGNQG
jgi:hypothetical protein